MATFTAGTSFTDGVTGDVTAAKLNALVANATPLHNLITDRTAETSVASDDLVLISDTSDSAALNKMTVANLMKAELTGTINSTAGTIATLNSTTGTIPTLAATTLLTAGTGTASAPAIIPTGDTNTGIFFPAADTVAATTGGTERLRIDSSGNVGIGTASPVVKLQVSGNIQGNEIFLANGIASSPALGTTPSWYSPASGVAALSTNSTERLRIDSSGRVGVGTASPLKELQINATEPTIRLEENSAGSKRLELSVNNAAEAKIFANQSGGTLILGTVGTERLRITSGGEVLIGKTTNALSSAGLALSNTANEFVVSGNPVQGINRLASDGTLVAFYQDTTLEGSISVSGTTVSYNGGHLARFSQLPSGQRDPFLKKGTVLSNLDEMCVWNDAEGNPLPNEQLNKVKVSDAEGDGNVAGLFVNWDNDDQYNPFDLNMAMTGDMIIRIAQGVIVNRGDLLMSAGDGTAKPQGDDIVRSKTIAKVTSTSITCTYEDGSYCVPCVIMAC